MPINTYKYTFDYYNLRNTIFKLRDNYKDLTAFSIGNSTLGRGLFALGIGNPIGASIFIGGINGCDKISSALLLNFTEQILQALDKNNKIAGIDISAVIAKHGLIIIPCLNPDGQCIALGGAKKATFRQKFVQQLIDNNPTLPWTANAEGVQINMNFNAGWYNLYLQQNLNGIISPAPSGFAGFAPFSEQETIAVSHLITAVNSSRCYEFTDGIPEIKYQYLLHTPEYSSLMAHILSSSYEFPVSTTPQNDGSLGAWFQTQFSSPAFQITVNDDVFSSSGLLEAMVLALMI
ncbi:MAG: M14 family zinc carboxypeptidase [Oscillospiraceae bacterium]